MDRLPDFARPMFLAAAFGAICGFAVGFAGGFGAGWLIWQLSRAALATLGGSFDG